MSEARRPLPAAAPDYRPFWDFVAAGRLHLQRCGACGRFRFPVSPRCPACFSPDWAWQPVSGRGVVSSWVVFHRSYYEAFADRLPYAVVQVELEEGPRLTANLLDAAPGELRIGLPVEVAYEAVADGVTLYQFRPARSS